jgi:hypothetical protein
MLRRLSLVLQNITFLIIPTPSTALDSCVLRLFREYFAACRALGDGDRARNAWFSLYRSGQNNVLEDPSAASDYLSAAFDQLHDEDREQARAGRKWSGMAGDDVRARLDHVIECAPAGARLLSSAIDLMPLTVVLDWASPCRIRITQGVLSAGSLCHGALRTPSTRGRERGSGSTMA